MDLIAYPMFRMAVRVKPGDLVSSRVWRSFAKNKNGCMGSFIELTNSGGLHGICWKFNPHETAAYRKFYNPFTDIATGHGEVRVWVYGLMPRGFAMLRRLSEGRNKARIKTLTSDAFFQQTKSVDYFGSHVRTE